MALTAMTDTRTMQVVESLYEGPRVVGADSTAVAFADLFIGCDQMYVPVLSTDGPGPQAAYRTALLRRLASRDSAVFAPLPYTLADGRTRYPVDLRDEFSVFAARAECDLALLQSVVRQHRFIDGIDPPFAQIEKHYVFNVHSTERHPRFEETMHRLQVSRDLLILLVEMSMRHMGELAGDVHYISDPFRRNMRYFGRERRDRPLGGPRISFGRYILDMHGLTPDGFAAKLHEARHLARELNLAGPLDRAALQTQDGAAEVLGNLQRFASRLGMRPSVRELGRPLSTLGTASLSALMGKYFGPVAAVVTATAMLSGHRLLHDMPPLVGRLGVLRSSLEWPIEAEFVRCQQEAK
ncbi:MAG: hypothetical protein NT029_05535 [Armatimonadetes bacterium]|nr:hypothetical protein [Armatimonadota bacterium]